MRTINNTTERFGDDLKSEVRRGTRLRIAAAAFSIFAFEALREELEEIDGLQFVFTAASFDPAGATDRVRKSRREFFIPGGHAESDLYGSEFEIRLRNKLTQRAVARECAEWVRRKVTFRSNATGQQIQPMTLVDDRAAYLSPQSFTTSDLGYERGNAMSNFIMKAEGPAETKQFLDTFDQIWNTPGQLTDVTQAVHDHIAAVYAENSPARIYFLILYNLFAEFLDDVSEDTLPNDRTGYEDSKIWSSLYNFQRDAATGIINKLETFNGCILADSVGLGKTFTALAVIKYYELRNRTVLVLCPKKLAENWTTYNSNYTTNLFHEDRLNYDVLAHTDLSRTRGESFGKQLDRLNWGNYDLVVIDESHNFRNADYGEGKESRYQRLMRQVIKEGVKTKVLMLSATPVNNRFNDLKNQLQLAYEGDSDDLSDHLDLSSSVETVFRDAQSVFNTWSKLPPEERTTERILRMLDFDFFELLDAVTIARSRKHIQAFYDTSAIGAFPRRLPPRAIREPLTDIDTAPSFNDIFDQLQVLNLGVYAPLSYVFPSRRPKYEDASKVTAGNARGNLGQGGREQGLKQLMTVNLLKRLESSVEAFRITLVKVERTVDVRLRQLELQAQIDDEDLIDGLGDLDIDDTDDAGIEALMVGDVAIDPSDIDVDRYRGDLWHDRETLRELISAMRVVAPEHDVKLQRLKQLIVDKVSRPINDGNRKILIFSAFADTAAYLYRELAPGLTEAGLNSGVITGGPTGARTTVGKGFDFGEIMAMFSPISKHRAQIMQGTTGDIDVLIGTDVISEGQNLQDCDTLINYDIHWNPVRIIQRFGRIDRIGSTNEVIQLINFWPDISLDEYINLKERVEGRMVIADLSGTGDDNVLDPDSAEATYRREQLRRLQDDVIELEDVRSGVSITDLGLNDFRMDLLAYTRQSGDLAGTPKGLHAVVPANEAIGLKPGALFALRNVALDPLRAERSTTPAERSSTTVERSRDHHNRLHPYYLVYVDDNGQVIADHTEAKRILDLLRAACTPYDEPVTDVVTAFNTDTAEGSEMGKYSDLLNAAIGSMIEVNTERDIDSLFTPGATTALTDTIAGLDDFELIAFIAILKRPGVE
ncbi:helicase-related protein [Gordonia sp. (in: high G+C Gram-positive bacteria)]|uniref:helicase-related protein n=1 Tax=Gordonia sp. (in: high G+C Gram-positive bacteria) TaxID=84139 RepID=UPI003527A7F9